MVHTPLKHVWFDAQTMPHPPQLFRSNCVLTHAPPHCVRPVLHTHAPPTQPLVNGVPLHALPHAPQLFRSV